MAGAHHARSADIAGLDQVPHDLQTGQPDPRRSSLAWRGFCFPYPRASSWLVEPTALERDEIAPRQLHALNRHYTGKLRIHDVRGMFEVIRDNIPQKSPSSW